MENAGENAGKIAGENAGENAGEMREICGRNAGENAGGFYDNTLLCVHCPMYRVSFYLLRTLPVYFNI